MALVTVDSNNLADVLKDAGVEPPKVEEPKAEEKVEVKEEPEDHPDDDKEGSDGLTPREKRELTEKMLRSVGKRVAQRKAAEEFADAQYREKQAAERRAEDLERQIAELKAQVQPEPQKDNREPKRENFATETEYIDARVDWKAEQKVAQREAERAAQDASKRMFTQVERAKELVPDFAQVTSSANLTVPPNVVEYMKESDLFAELGYYFAKNPDVMKKLELMAPVKQLVELGKIESKLSPFAPAAKDEPLTEKPEKAEPSTLDTGLSPSKARSDAPVIRPLTSGEGSQVQPDTSEMNTREMIQAWQKTNKVKLTLRKRH
jgi:hypothetical protein